jgi:anti-sigma B factor antagonist
MFRFERNDRDGAVVLTLHGTLDALTAAALKAEVVAIAEAGALRVVVDLAGLTLIDSTGVGVLISLFKRARTHKGQVAYAGVHGQPKEIFRLLRLDRSLDLCPTVADALAKLK